jgi:hypothetical protein
MALDNFRVAPLPNPPAQWDPQYMRQVIRVLELYFNQLDSNTPNHAQQYTATEFIGGNFTGTNITATNATVSSLQFNNGVGNSLNANTVRTVGLTSGSHLNIRQVSADLMADNVYASNFYGDGKHVNTPYNQFISTSNQTAANTATAYALTYDTSDFPDGINLSNSSHINVTHEGIYLFTYSIQFENTNNSTETVDVWFRKNGNDLANSNSSFSLPARKSATAYSYIIAVTPIMLDLADNDYIQIMWHVSDVAVSVKTVPAVTASPGVTPAIPASPSVILTAQFVSAQFPAVTRVAPLPVFGFGQIGTINVLIR